MFRDTSVIAAGVWVIAMVAVVFLLRAASQLLIPIVLAALISYALEPVVAWLQSRRVPRLLGASAVLLAILALGGWGILSLRDDAIQVFEALPEVARRARELVWSGGGSGPAQRIQEAATELQRPPEGDKPDVPMGTSGGQQQSGAAGSAITQWVQQGVGSVLALAGHITVIFFLVFSFCSQVVTLESALSRSPDVSSTIGEPPQRSSMTSTRRFSAFCSFVW